MGLLDIPLNTGTALVSTVALGIAVDDTIHFLTDYLRNRRSSLSVQESVQASILSKGTGMVASSLVLVIGFGVLMLGSFVPTAYFGLLCAVIMVSAILGDILLLPAILLLKSD
jgi:predicted RND superfamily exporter protein